MSDRFTPEEQEQVEAIVDFIGREQILKEREGYMRGSIGKTTITRQLKFMEATITVEAVIDCKDFPRKSVIQSIGDAIPFDATLGTL